MELQNFNFQILIFCLIIIFYGIIIPIVIDVIYGKILKKKDCKLEKEIDEFFIDNKRTFYVLSTSTNLGIQYYLGCDIKDKSYTSSKIEEAVIFQTKELAELIIPNLNHEFNITPISISELENFFFPFNDDPQ
jgi:hypothetical protein